MSNEATVAFSGDASGILKAYKEIDAAEENHKKKIREGVTAAREAAAEERRLKREAEGLTKANETAQERYNRRIAEAKKHVDAGRISQETYNRELARQRDLANGASTSTSTLTGTIASLATGLGSVTAAFTAAAMQQERFREQTEQSVMSLDEWSRKFAIQQGLTTLQTKDATRQILDVAQENAVTPEKAFSAATQLVSSGFNAPQETGTLDAFLKILASGNLGSSDPVQSIQAMSQFMSAFQMQKNGQNMMDIGVRMRGLFAGTDVQMSDMSNLAGAAPSLNQAGLSLEESLSAFTLLREQMAPGEASTKLRNVVQNLQVSGSQKDRVETLKSMGMKPEDVDFQGENLEGVLDNLRKGLSTLPPEQQVIAQAKLVEKENLGALVSLLSGQDKMQEFNVMQQDKAGFVLGVQTAQSGPNAAMRRKESKQAQMDLFRMDTASRRVLEKQAIEEEDRDYAESLGFLGIGDTIFNKVIRDPIIGMTGNRRMWITPEKRREMDRQQSGSFSADKLDAMLSGQGRTSDAIERQTQEMTRQSREQLTATRRASGSPLDANSRENR